MQYRGSTAVVTGAASGIGRALAIDLAKRGAHVAISDVNATGLAETAAECKRDGIDVRTYELDVADRGAVLQHAEEVRRDFGSVHLVINNAGVALGATVEEMSWEDYDWLMGINRGGVVHGTKAFLPLLIESGTKEQPSHVVNVSSVFGFIGMPTHSAYNAAKFAVRGVTESLRQEMIIARRPKAARTILRGVDKDQARILIGLDAVVIDAVPRILGARYEGIAARGARILGPRVGLDLEH